MTKRETILTLILFIAISWLGYSALEENHAEEISVLQNRIMILEEIIKNYEVIEVLNYEIDVVAHRQAAIDEHDPEWINWLTHNMWIVEVDWGE